MEYWKVYKQQLCTSTKVPLINLGMESNKNVVQEEENKRQDESVVQLSPRIRITDEQLEFFRKTRPPALNPDPSQKSLLGPYPFPELELFRNFAQGTDLVRFGGMSERGLVNAGVTSFIDTELNRTNGSLDGSNNSGRSTPGQCSSVNGINGGSLTYDTKLFVGGLSWSTTPDKLKEYFTQYGPVLDVLVMRDPITQRSRGFGFITFSEAVSVNRVLAEVNHILDGKKIDPKHATPRTKTASNKPKKVFVGGVSQDTTLEDLQTYFSQYGKVDEAVMLMDQQTRRHRGFGFVTFEGEDVVDKVCAMHYHIIKGKKVECKRAQPKDTSSSLNVLAKRMVLTGPPLTAQGLGIPGPLAAAAVANYSKLLGSHSASVLGSYRYSPYTIPTLGSGPHGSLPSLPYGAYPSLPTLIDVSSLPSVDWSSVYNAF